MPRTSSAQLVGYRILIVVCRSGEYRPPMLRRTVMRRAFAPDGVVRLNVYPPSPLTAERLDQLYAGAGA